MSHELTNMVLVYLFFFLQLLSDQTIKCTWINSSDVFALTSFVDDVVYVVDPTEGIP